jgi:Putative transposase
VLNGVFEEVFEELQGGAVGDDKATSANVIFHPASGIDDTAVAQVQATLRKRILRAFVGRGLLHSFQAQEMLGYQHSGFFARRWCVHPSARPRRAGAAIALLCPPTLRHGAPSQRGRYPGVPLRETA